MKTWVEGAAEGAVVTEVVTTGATEVVDVVSGGGVVVVVGVGVGVGVVVVCGAVLPVPVGVAVVPVVAMIADG